MVVKLLCAHGKRRRGGGDVVAVGGQCSTMREGQG